MEVYKTAPIPCSLNSTNPCQFDIYQSLRIAINTNMSHRSRLGPYMDPRVFRSTTTSAYHVEFDPTSPRYATTNAWDSLSRDPRDAYFEDPQAAYSYRSDRRHYSQHNASSRDVDDLVRRSAILRKQRIHCSSDKACRTNQNVGVGNNSIDRVSNITLIQPKVCTDGQYPVDFSTPMALSDLLRWPESLGDHLLDEYGVPLHRQRDHGTSQERLIDKLSDLLDFLGARQIADVLRTKSGCNLSSHRHLLTGSRR